MQTEHADTGRQTVEAAVQETPIRTADQTPQRRAALSTPNTAAAPAQPAARTLMQPQLLLSNLMQMGDTALQSELQVGCHAKLILTAHIAMPSFASHATCYKVCKGQASCQPGVLTLALLELWCAQRCMTTPAFWSLVDRIEALWDKLGLPSSTLYDKGSS